MKRLTLTAALLAACVPAFAGIRVEAYGVTQGGQPVQKVTLENARGMRLAYIDYGATLIQAEVADRQGKRRNVILSLPDLAAFERTRGRYGAIIGRYAGRIANARYTLEGKTVQLVPNNRGMAIHGDPAPYDKRVWLREDFNEAESLGSVYRLHSPDGDQNFPGAMDISVTYRLLRNRDEFRIEYEVRTTAPTVHNLTNHLYLNLAGAAANTLEDHSFQIAADRYLDTDAMRIPSGVMLDVAGTPFDFRQAASVHARLPSVRGGYDHSLIFSKPAGAYAQVATVRGGGIRMEVSTSEPSVQLYTVNGFDGKEVGSEGVGYQRYGAFAFETQHLPDSPNHANFPSTALYPGQVYRSRTSFSFAAD
ncbi:aldose epimerase family protein [Duganella sp.]|uniref:aldose epimerase family protein n=1 Tax=Duganella sp. TaxID=1904440 RepID=UPI0031DD93B7